MHFPQTMQQAVFQTAIPVKQLVIADQSNSFAQLMISDAERGASVQVRRESEVRPVREQVLFASTKHTLPQSPSSS